MSNDVVPAVPRARERAQQGAHQQATDPAIANKNDSHPDGKCFNRKAVYPVGHIIFSYGLTYTVDPEARAEQENQEQ